MIIIIIQICCGYGRDCNGCNNHYGRGGSTQFTTAALSTTTKAASKRRTTATFQSIINNDNWTVLQYYYNVSMYQQYRYLDQNNLCHYYYG